MQPFTDAISLEYAFEQNAPEVSETILSPSHWQLLELVDHSKFTQAYQLGNKLLEQSAASGKSLTLVWLIICSEKQYDLEQKKRFLSQLSLHYNETKDNYCLFHLFYFRAINMIYDSQFLEALSLLTRAEKIATEINYPRGEVRCTFHKFLIYKLIGNFELAESYRMMALTQLESAALPKLRTKLKLVLDVGPGSFSDADQIQKLIFEMRSALKNRDYGFAKKLCLHAEAGRRKIGVSKKRYSLYFELAKINFLLGHTQRAHRLLKSIDDLTLKSHLRDFLLENNIDSNGDLFAADSEIFKSLHPVKAAGIVVIEVKKIKNLDLAKFIKVLNDSNEPLEKQQIFQLLYNDYYDPVVHDPKIYRLVLWIKKRVAIDCLVNHYGKYSLNREKYKVVG